jgi:hypothetical protein
VKILVLLFASTALAQPPTPQAHNPLKPWQFKWQPERAPQGPVVIIVNLTEQRAYVYRNGIRIGETTVSTGRPGHVTPTGVFTILQKETMHHSNLYDGAPMPYMQRLTWGGVCLHAGGLPGYPSSHGCVHLPLEFAKLLYGVTGTGTTVVITSASSSPDEVARPSILIPAQIPGLPTQPPLEASPGTAYAWQPELAPDGPVSVLVSGADRRVYVYRNGVRIGDAAIGVNDPNPPLVDAVYTMLEGTASHESALVPGRPAHRWMRVDVASPSGEVVSPDLGEHIQLPPGFAPLVYDALQPGTTLFVTNHAATPETSSGPGFVVMQSGAESE